MFPNPTTPTIHTAHSDTLLRRLLGGMSLFTMLMTIPQVLTIWLGHQAVGGFAVIVERLPWFGYRNTARTSICHVWAGGC